MRSLGFSPTQEESIRYWNKYKSEGGIPFSVFLNILYAHSKAEDCENEVMAAFAAQDRKKNGLISTKDFRAIMCNSGEKINPKLIDAVLKESGQTGNQIRYATVVKTLLSPPADY
ncbi:calmodulin-like protein 4 [Watersipora subatra]|uniref:calmodulin-like protein 4 n=1 Tax=Watersipora subatra TaxID=2589382 RepID=UPI00355B895C